MAKSPLKPTPEMIALFDTLRVWKKDRKIMNDKEKIEKALAIAISYGGIGGDHHKAWVIDQMVRVLSGKYYKSFVKSACAGEDGPNTYEWNEGIAP